MWFLQHRRLVEIMGAGTVNRWSEPVESFDPYLAWLDIPLHERPVNHYRLLGLPKTETNPQMISAAADRVHAHLMQFQAGPQAAQCQVLLGQVASARTCLLDPASKTAYDQAISGAGQETKMRAAPPVPGVPAQASSGPEQQIAGAPAVPGSTPAPGTPLPSAPAPSIPAPSTPAQTIGSPPPVAGASPQPQAGGGSTNPMNPPGQAIQSAPAVPGSPAMNAPSSLPGPTEPVMQSAPQPTPAQPQAPAQSYPPAQPQMPAQPQVPGEQQMQSQPQMPGQPHMQAQPQMPAQSQMPGQPQAYPVAQQGVGYGNMPAPTQGMAPSSAPPPGMHNVAGGQAPPAGNWIPPDRSGQVGTTSSTAPVQSAPGPSHAQLMRRRQSTQTAYYVVAVAIGLVVSFFALVLALVVTRG